MGEFWRLTPSGAPALIGADGSVLSHARLEARVDALAGRLAAAPGKRLAVLLADGQPDCVIAYLALLRAGHAVLLLPPESPALAAVLHAYAPDWVMGAAAAPDGFAPGEAEGLALHSARKPSDLLLHADLAVLLMTSGSTGNPKAVRLSRAALAANARQIVQALRMGPEDRAVQTLSPAYSFGLSVVNSHLLCGGSLLLTGRTPLEREFWQDLGQHGVTTMPGVPFTYDVIRRAGGAGLAPAGLRKLLQAGGRMEPAMIRWTRDAFAGRAELFVMYGQTEATARMAVLPPEELGDDAVIGAVGRPLPGASVEVDGDGQIVYCGPNVMMGYAQEREDLALGDQLFGILATGDLGRLDPDGRLWITGRLKRIVKPFGLRINLDDIEAQLSGLGTLAVTGDDKGMVVSVEAGDDAVIAEAARRLAADMKLPAALVRVRRVQALPRSANGKVRYGEL